MSRLIPANYTGLLPNKKAYVVVTARGGGGYGPGEAREAYNSFRTRCIKNAFGLMGVTDMEFIHVNNTAFAAMTPSTAHSRKPARKSRRLPKSG